MSAVRKDDTRRIEDEARKMELKLDMLRKTMEATEPATKGSDGGRWKNGAPSKPLTKGYVKGVLEAPKKMRNSQQKPDVSARSGGSSINVSGKNTPTPPAQEGHVSELLGNSRANVEAATTQAPTIVPPAMQGTAANNLQAAMLRQSDEARNVETFLAELKLDRYVGLFMEHGFDCMEVVKEMQECHMQDIGMAAGHILKLKKKLAEFAPVTTNFPSATGPGTTQRRVTFNGAVNTPQASGGKTSSSHTENTSSNLMHGQFSEEDSAASFQDALRAWREGRDDADPVPSSSKPAVKATGSFWSTVGGGEMDLERASTPLRTPTELAQAEIETQHGPAPGDDKLCCYQCYKQFFAKHAVERHSPLPEGGMKRLCSEACAELWAATMQEKMDALQKRQKQLGKMQEMHRAIEEETRAANAAASAAAAQGDAVHNVTPSPLNVAIEA